MKTVQDFVRELDATIHDVDELARQLESATREELYVLLIIKDEFARELEMELKQARASYQHLAERVKSLYRLTLSMDG